MTQPPLTRRRAHGAPPEPNEARREGIVAEPAGRAARVCLAGEPERALGVLDALIKEFSARGFGDCPDRADALSARILGVELPLVLEERVERTPHVETEEEQRRRRRSFRPPKLWDYRPTGSLSLRILTEDFGLPRKTWSDTKRRRLEDQLDDFVFGAITIADILRARRLERERRQREREEVERRWREEQDRRRREPNAAKLWRSR